MAQTLHFGQCAGPRTRRAAGSRRRLADCTRLLILFAAVAVAALGFAPVANANQVDEDLAPRSSQIHWPGHPNPSEADMFSHNEISINVPCSTVWDHLVDATGWPSRYPNSHAVKIVRGESRLGPHAHFVWNTFSTHISSTVAEYLPDSRLGWFGYGPHIAAYHTWLLIPAEQSCHVVTEEATQGPAATSGRHSHPASLHNAHEVWIAGLKKLAESWIPLEVSTRIGAR